MIVEQKLSLEERIKRLEEVIIVCYGTLNTEKLEALRKENGEYRKRLIEKSENSPAFAELMELKAKLTKEIDERKQLEKMEELN